MIVTPAEYLQRNDCVSANPGLQNNHNFRTGSVRNSLRCDGRVSDQRNGYDPNGTTGLWGQSSTTGMRARLAFATAMSVSPDILLVDEALTVGDALFADRCYRRIRDIVRAGASVLLVALSPLMLLTALAVKLTSEGPIIFAQERYGLNRRRFRMLKSVLLGISS